MSPYSFLFLVPLIKNNTTKVIIYISVILNKCSIFEMQKIMSLNKNKIVGITSLIMAIIGTSLILVGIFKYREYAIGFSIAGVGFYAIAWAFNALRGRI